MITGMRSVWQRLFSNRIYALGGPIADYQDVLPAQEAALAESMQPARRAEFTAGRTQARQALSAIGAPVVALPRDTAGAPRWPSGITGSITHVRHGDISYCAAAVSRQPSLLGLGLDAEPREPLPPRLGTRILTDRERQMSATMPAWTDRLIFSIKECVYKCFYPSSGRFLDFHDVEVEIHMDAEAFTVRIRQPGPHEQTVEPLRGRFVTQDDLIITAIELDRLHMKRIAS